MLTLTMKAHPFRVFAKQWRPASWCLTVILTERSCVPAKNVFIHQKINPLQRKLAKHPKHFLTKKPSIIRDCGKKLQESPGNI